VLYVAKTMFLSTVPDAGGTMRIAAV